MAGAGEYGDMCAMGLAMGKKIPTNCTINGTLGGKKYCFGSEEAKASFMNDPEGNLAKASDFYKSL